MLGLQCVSCRSKFDFAKPQTTCTKCGSMLSATYDLESIKESFRPQSLAGRVPSLWRYREVLPVLNDENIVTLGEGLTPLLRLRGRKLLMKDDGQGPTGTFKARGMAVAVSKAKELGISKLAVPSAGNAGAALACYSAFAGISARVYMPNSSPPSTMKECRAYGAQLVMVDGNIGDAAERMKADADGYFDVSTLREPYRLEGKKTMGYEIAEQTGLQLPDVIVYPTGGGTGLLGMVKAFDEMEELGWIGNERPRMVAVQSEACAPIVRAFLSGRETVTEQFQDTFTVASGLRVPKPFAAREVLKALRRSGGTAMAVKEEEITRSMHDLAKEGVFACPEGAATLACYDKLRSEGTVATDEEVLLYNTGSGLKYLELF